VIATVLFLNCAVHKKQLAFAWLEGKWFSVDMRTMEEWKRVGQEWHGTTYRLKEAKVLETMRLYPAGTGWAFEAQVPDQNDGKPIIFTSENVGIDSFLVANPSHDFPKYILYKNLGEGRMRATIYNDIAEKQAQILYKDGLRQRLPERKTD
jgi:hypothetical protein